MASFSERIKQKARELGIDKIGIVPAEALSAEGERLNEWLVRGYHADMAWLARDPEKRADPTKLFAGAKSVIAVAMNYYTPAEHDVGAEGNISRYAWGDDYHEVVKEKLRALLAWIKTESPGIDGMVCVDTSAVMDKAWAARAGLGWIGKHSNLITKDLGSWVFLGEVIVDGVLDYDAETVVDHCGTCTACLDACPTQAIVEPYVVDSNLCISYGTIESRDERLPETIEANLDGWLYGCDICQDVCPWNRFETPTDETRFEPRRGETAIEPERIIKMPHDDYAERFRRSAIKRAKLSGLKRNAEALIRQRAERKGV